MRFLFRSFIGTRVKIAVLGISLSVLALAGTAHAEPSRKPAFSPSKQPTAKAFSDQRQGLPQPPGPSLMLDERDELATLHAIHMALQTVGDGGAYIWHRDNGLLDGVVRPTTSFKSAHGSVCRHIIIELNSGPYSRKAEGIACRDARGRWSLSG
jgi:surface antigen